MFRLAIRLVSMARGRANHSSFFENGPIEQSWAVI